jgi:hypothetical protein
LTLLYLIGSAWCHVKPLSTNLIPSELHEPAPLFPCMSSVACLLTVKNNKMLKKNRYIICGLQAAEQDGQ